MIVLWVFIPAFFMQIYPHKLVVSGPWRLPYVNQYNLDKLKTAKFH